MLISKHRFFRDSHGRLCSPIPGLCRAVLAPITCALMLGCAAPLPPPPPPSGLPVPEQRAFFTTSPDSVFPALRQACAAPTQRVVQTGPDAIECRMLLPPDATAGAILRYGGMVTQLPELVIRLRLTPIDAGYELAAAQYLEVPRATGGDLRVVYPDPQLERRLRAVLASFGGEVSP